MEASSCLVGEARERGYMTMFCLSQTYLIMDILKLFM